MDILVPTELNTERLLLRQFKDEDWRDLHQHYSDAEAKNTHTANLYLRVKPGELCVACWDTGRFVATALTP